MKGGTNSIIAHTDWYATIFVTTSNGTMVTCNGFTKEATYGNVEFKVYKQGTYTITGTLEGHTNTTTCYVYSATSYYETLYMSATIRANAPAGTEVSCNGETKTVTGTYVDFTVYETGSYTVTGVLNGITTTNTVYVGTMGQTYSTTLVFGCYINIYSNIGTDVIYNGLRQTVGDTGYVRYWITGTGTYKFLCIYKGQSKTRDVVVTSTASDIDESIYFVPSAYQQVEWIQSSGTQYIDTGLTSSNVTSLNVTTEFEIVTFPSSSNGLIGFINRSASVMANDMLGCVFVTNLIYSYIYTTSSTQLTQYTTQAGIKYKYILDYKNNISTASLNGVTYTYNNTSQTKVITKNFYLFKINDTSVTVGASAKIYSCSIELNGNIVRKFVPCYRKSDNVAGMYDLVNGVFYDNDGTGTFTCGDPVANASLPSEYTYVKYIASTSAKTQYLNLGETGTNTSGMLIKVYDELEDITKDNVYVGGRATQNGRFWIGGTYCGSDIQQYLTYLGWNTLKRLINAAGEYTENISATKTLRTFYVNYLNNRQEGYDNTKAFDITETLVQNTPLYAFAASNNGSLALNSWMRLYYAVLTSGTTISNIFIPCYRNSDNEIGMYDIVKGNFKTNAGSGTFVISQN